jgi:NAD(P)-dependent dehydrogenase (short-subunit alcohol dehydrogenase family)
VINTNQSDRFLKTALVVGGGRGIGLGFVRTLLADDRVDRVYTTYRRLDSARELLAITDDRLCCLQMDITEEAQIEKVISHIKLATTSLHYVINCIGVLHEGTLQPEKSLRHINADRMLHYFQVNSIGAILLFKHIQPLVKHQDRSIIATISAKVGSISDNQLGGWYGYRASKAALNMLIKTTAIEYKRTCPQAILVALHPGTTDTQLSLPFQGNVPTEKLFSVDRTVGQLWKVLEQLNPNDSGEFFAWDGSKIPW